MTVEEALLLKANKKLQFFKPVLTLMSIAIYLEYISKQIFSFIRRQALILNEVYMYEILYGFVYSYYKVFLCQ